MAALPPGERTPSTHWIESWVGPRTDLDDMENSNLPIVITCLNYQAQLPNSSQFIYNSMPSILKPKQEVWVNCTV
jgi:hypothetical protein